MSRYVLQFETLMTTFPFNELGGEWVRSVALRGTRAADTCCVGPGVRQHLAKRIQRESVGKRRSWILQHYIGQLEDEAWDLADSATDTLRTFFGRVRRCRSQCIAARRDLAVLKRTAGRLRRPRGCLRHPLCAAAVGDANTCSGRCERNYSRMGRPRHS